MKLTTRKLAALGLFCASAALPAANAHDAWPVAQNDGYKVVYGHQGKPEPYAPSKVKAIQAFDKHGQPLEITRSQAPDNSVGFEPAGAPALLTIEFDNGYWTQTTKGSVNLPKDKAEGALSAAHLVKFSKTVVEFAPGTTKPAGQRLEIVPMATQAPVKGAALPVQVLWEGKPLPDAALMRGHEDPNPVQTDEQGKASLPLTEGRQAWVVTHKQALQNDPQADDYSASANLIFELK